MFKKIVSYLPFIFMFLSFGFLVPRTYALTTETIYANSSSCTLADSGKFKNVSSNGTISTNNINTTYNGKSYGMQFYFAEDMITTKVYQLKITFMADDLLPRVNESFIELITYDTSCESDYATILSIEKNTTSGNATTLQINFIPSMVSNKARILVGSSSGPIQITGETTFGIKSVQIGDRESQGNEQIIINQNQNTQNVINNQNQNTQNIIDNQNQNSQDMIDSQKSCTTYDKSNVSDNGKYLGSTGGIGSNSSYGISDYININDGTLEITDTNGTSWVYACYYKKDKTVISCNAVSTLNGLQTIPSNAYYFRTTIYLNGNTPKFKVCKNGNQAITDSITDDNVDNSDAVDFFNNFSYNSHGLSGIISAPLNSINAMLNNQCSPLTATWEGQDISFPCGYDFWNRLSVIKSFLNIVLDGLICYRILIKLFKLIENIKKPDDDRIEVVDL